MGAGLRSGLESVRKTRDFTLGPRSWATRSQNTTDTPDAPQRKSGTDAAHPTRSRYQESRLVRGSVGRRAIAAQSKGLRSYCGCSVLREGSVGVVTGLLRGFRAVAALERRVREAGSSCKR